MSSSLLGPTGATCNLAGCIWGHMLCKGLPWQQVWQPLQAGPAAQRCFCCGTAPYTGNIAGHVALAPRHPEVLAHRHPAAQAIRELRFLQTLLRSFLKANLKVLDHKYVLAEAERKKKVRHRPNSARIGDSCALCYPKPAVLYAVLCLKRM